MKKLMCVLILVAFIGGMVVMTGCFGGSDGIGAILAGVLIITLVASGPGTAAVFAASERSSSSALRAVAVPTVSTKYVARITPTGRTPVEFTNLTVENKTISFKDVQVEAGTNGQVLIEIFPTGYTSTTAPIFKFYTVKAVADGGSASGNYSITASDTAKALLYEAWTSSSTFTFDNFSPTALQVNNVAAEIITRMENNGSTYTSSYTFKDTAVETAVNANKPTGITLPAVSGYVYRKDGTPRSGHMVWLKQGETVSHCPTDDNGYFLIQNITPGNWVLSPEPLADHTFSPANYSLTIAAGSALTNQNFQSQ